MVVSNADLLRQPYWMMKRRLPNGVCACYFADKIERNERFESGGGRRNRTEKDDF